MTTVDLVALAVIAAFAWVGYRSGLIGGLAWIVGLVAGAAIAARLAPAVLPGGADSPWSPTLAMVGAAAGASLFASLLSRAATRVRKLMPIPFLGMVDRALGLALGTAVGVTAVWIAAVLLVDLPAARPVRSDLRGSAIVQALGNAMPSAGDVLGAVGRFDPLPTFTGTAGVGLPEPDRAILRDPSVRGARRAVVRVRAESCGFAIEGSGWVAAPGLVVTNAHVVAGDGRPSVEPRGNGFGFDSKVVVFDRFNDIAVLRVPGLKQPRLRQAVPEWGSRGAVLGYPLDGGFRAGAATIGRTMTVLADDAYGNGPIRRSVVLIRGLVQPGNSGGPVIDQAGRTVATVYGKSSHGGGLAVPVDITGRAIFRAQSGASDPVGPCAR